MDEISEMDGKVFEEFLGRVDKDERVLAILASATVS
jgi:hypothetical protein